MRQPSARAAKPANSTAFRLSTGRAPGNPKQTGQTFVFGGSPKRVEQEQKILVVVRSWTCTSRPMTGSYFARTAAEMSETVDIISDYSRAGPVDYGLLAGALRYFSNGISKNITSLPFASRTPVRKKCPPASGVESPET